jgi:hypothetical protein
MIVRTYQETISDALEACFSFKDFSLKDYIIQIDLADEIDFFAALKKALELEEKAINFYSEVAIRSESLLATITRAFQKACQRRKKSQNHLKLLLEEFEV